jgi:hypothetical protein
MKKLLSVVIVLALVCAFFMIPADAKANVKDVWFEGENVKVRAGADLALLRDNKILSEENAVANDFNKSGIVLVQNTAMMDAENNTVATMYIELDSVQNIDTVYLTWYVYHNAIIGLPHNNNLIIGVSENGETYTEIGAYDFEGETDPNSSFQLDLKIRLGQTVKAKYVSVSFEFGPNGQDGWYCPMWEWVGFTEVGAGLMVDELGDSYDEVSEDNTPLDQIDPIVEIPEGNIALTHAKFNTSITTGSYTIITDLSTVNSYNVKWATTAHLRPTETEGVYEVVEIIWGGGSDITFTNEAEEGDIALAVHGDDEADGTKANRLALNALTTEDTVTFAGYDFEKLTFERGAVVYFVDHTATGGDTSETPDEPSEEPSEDPSEEPSEDESAPADESVPATESTPVVDNSEAGEEGGNTGLIIGIVAGVVAVIAIVVVVVIVVKKKK